MSAAHHHGHDHGHGHGHSHAPANFNTAFAVGIGLNIAFVAIEGFYGWKINSLAPLAGARNHGELQRDVHRLRLYPAVEALQAPVPDVHQAQVPWIS